MSRLILPILILLLALGCARKIERGVVSGEARISVGDEVVSDSPQQRTLPWADMNIESSARFSVAGPPSEGQMNLSRGTRMALAKLDAREAAIADVSRQLASLPAAEAPPGETGRLTLLQFSERRPALNFAMRGELESALEEEIRQASPDEGAMVIKLSLRPLAETLLLHGGGFRQENAIVQDAGPRARASAQALRLAREDLLKKLMERNIERDLTFEEWLQENPANRQLLVKSLENIRVIQSELVTRASDDSQWVTELEYDPAPLQSEILANRARGDEIRRSNEQVENPNRINQKRTEN